MWWRKTANTNLWPPPRAYTHVYSHTQTCQHMCTHIHKCMCTHIHAHVYPHTQTHMCTHIYKYTQKLRWQPIVQVFKRIKHIYSDINFHLMSHSFILSDKWLSRAEEATNGCSITMRKKQNLCRGNEDLVLLLRLLLSLTLKFLKSSTLAADAVWGTVARAGMKVRVALVQNGEQHQKTDVSGLPTLANRTQSPRPN